MPGCDVLMPFAQTLPVDSNVRIWVKSGCARIRKKEVELEDNDDDDDNNNW